MARRLSPVIAGAAGIVGSLLLVVGLVVGLTPPAGATPKPQHFTVTATLRPASITLGEKSTLSGKVKPVRKGADVLVQRRKGNTWVTVGKRPMKADGTFAYQIKPASVGTYTYRARMPKTGKVVAANSPARTLTVDEAADPNIVEFTIPPGTGSGSFNTSETRVLAEVGQTLRITNGDSEAHRLHTDGSPFPHPGTDIAPGATVDFVLESAFNGDSLYCHTHGTGSRFYLTVTDPDKA